MKQLLTLSNGLLAMLLVIALSCFGCRPGSDGPVLMEVPEGMASATFAVSGMV